MNISSEFKQLSHHAYVLTGGPRNKTKLLQILEKKFNIPSQGNPDFYDRDFESFTIDDARQLKSSHETRPVGPTGKKIFVISLDTITTEAQNALLKLLEEPGEYAHFFLVVPSASALLPTVLSRVQIIEIEGQGGVEIEGSDEIVAEAQKYIGLSTVKQLEVIKKLVDDISKEKKTRREAIDFLNAVETEIRARGVKNNIKVLTSIQLVRKYLGDRAPSVKMLLEYIALSQK